MGFDNSGSVTYINIKKGKFAIAAPSSEKGVEGIVNAKGEMKYYLLYKKMQNVMITGLAFRIDQFTAKQVLQVSLSMDDNNYILTLMGNAKIRFMECLPSLNIKEHIDMVASQKAFKDKFVNNIAIFQNGEIVRSHFVVFTPKEEGKFEISYENGLKPRPIDVLKKERYAIYKEDFLTKYTEKNIVPLFSSIDASAPTPTPIPHTEFDDDMF